MVPMCGGVVCITRMVCALLYSPQLKVHDIIFHYNVVVYYIWVCMLVYAIVIVILVVSLMASLFGPCWLALLWLLGSLLCSLLCTWCLPRWLVNYGSFVALEMGVDTTSRNRGNVRGNVRAHIRTRSMLQFARGWFRGRKQRSLLNIWSLSLGTYIVVLHFGKQTRHKWTGKLLMTTFNTNTRDQIAGWSCNEDIDILVESAHTIHCMMFRDMMPMD